MSMIGPMELIVIAFVGLWNCGLPLVLIYFGVRIWQRLQRIEEQIGTITTQMPAKEGSRA